MGRVRRRVHCAKKVHVTASSPGAMAAPSSPVHATAMGQDFGSEFPHGYPTSAQCAAHDKQNSSRDDHAQLPARKADGGIGLPKNIAAQIKGETGPGGAAEVCFNTHKPRMLASAARMSALLLLASRFTLVVASTPPDCGAPQRPCGISADDPAALPAPVPKPIGQSCTHRRFAGHAADPAP